MLFYNLLIVDASNYPRVVTLDVNNVQDLYPNKLTGSATATFNPLADSWYSSATWCGMRATTGLAERRIRHVVDLLDLSPSVTT